MPSRKSIKNLYELLQGKPVLLSVRPKQKRPANKGWSLLEYEDTDDMFYQTQLQNGNIGVMLGANSCLKENGKEYHLCSIDVDSDESAELFLEYNPWLKKTLITRGCRGQQFWLWVEPGYEGQDDSGYIKVYHLSDGETYEKDHDRPWGEWRCGGGKQGAQTVIMGTHPEGMEYKVLSKKHPKRIKWEEINWPEEIWIPWRKSPFERLVDAHGLGHVVAPKTKRISLNPPFFAAKFAMEHPVIFEGTEGEFYFYDSEMGLWKVVSDNWVKVRFIEDFHSYAMEYKVPGLLFKRSNAFISSFKEQVKGFIERYSVFGIHRGLIHFKNCMVQLPSSSPEELTVLEPGVYDFDQSYFSRNQIPFDFDEDARWEGTLFMKFMEYALEQDDIDFLQKAAGSLLLGYNPASMIVVLEGKGGTGKSTLVSILEAIIGDANIRQLRTECLNERFEIASFVGRTWLIGSEAPSNFLMVNGAEKIKALTGGDTMSAEFKTGKTENIKAFFNLWIITNCRMKMKLQGDASAYGRRMQIIRFNRAAPTNPDPLLKEKIIASEASAVINWAIQGAIKLLSELAPENGGRIQVSDAHRERTESLLAESSSVKYFVRGRVVKERGSDATLNELNAAYVDFCDERGWIPSTSRIFSREIKDSMTEELRVGVQNGIKRNDKAQQGFTNVRILKPEAEPSDSGEREKEGRNDDESGSL